MWVFSLLRATTPPGPMPTQELATFGALVTIDWGSEWLQPAPSSAAAARPSKMRFMSPPMDKGRGKRSELIGRLPYSLRFRQRAKSRWRFRGSAKPLAAFGSNRGLQAFEIAEEFL